MAALTKALVGRDDELRQVGLLLGGARNSRGGALLVHGEPGIGKTTLLSAACAEPAGMSVIRVDGYESESTIPFAALQRSFTSLGAHFDALPQRQQQALRVAAGLVEGPPPDRFLVGLGVLGLLAAAAEETPVLWAVDDAHHLDSESLDVLAFVSRRLEAESVALLFAGRSDEGLEARISGVPSLLLAGLSGDDAVHLLMESLPEPIDPAAAAQIAAATGGNPLALVDLAQGLPVEQLTAMSLGEEPIPVGHHLEAHYVRRVRATEADVQDWLLLAAADSTGNITMIRDAATRLGLPLDAGDRAERAGLIELTDIARFRHPLVRAAVYNSVSGADRRRVHAALAEAADEFGLVELEAWHAAKATLGVAPEVADRLERAADLAARRGGALSRASVLARAADLTPPGNLKDGRLLSAAEAALLAGAAQISRQMLEQVSGFSGHDPVLMGRSIMLRSALAIFTSDGPRVLRASADAIEAADLFHGHAPTLEQAALNRAFEFCCTTDRLMTGLTLPALSKRLQRGATHAEGPAVVIGEGMSALLGKSYDQAVPAVRDAVAAMHKLENQDLMHLGTAIAALTTYLWDERGRSELLDRAAAGARDAGALQQLDILLWIIGLSELTGGSVKRAQQSNEQVRELRRAIGYDAEIVVNAALMAWTGADRELVHLIGEGAAAAGFGGVQASAVAALAVRDIAEGHYVDAYHRLTPWVQDPFLQVTPLQYPDYVEAAIRAGHAQEANNLASRMVLLADVNDSTWCRGLAERSVALVASDEDAEPHFQAALTALATTEAIVDQARTHLLFGEWLRRVKRRREAGIQLNSALEKFNQGGASIFLARTRTELEALGGAADGTSGRDAYDLTAQELTVARLAAEGHTNPEIGSTLFISPNTVDYHLRKVFQKLGISSRRQLADKLAGARY